MSKPLSNGHDKEAAAEVPNASTIRARRYRDRKRKGSLVIRDIEVAAPAIDILIAGGWLHPSQREDREAVKLALSSICGRVLASGVTNSDLPIVEADVRALQVAAAWVKPGAQLSMQNVGRALSTAAICAEQAGFCPAEYGQRVKAMMGLN